jgi:AraC-like DNA-binding protein
MRRATELLASTELTIEAIAHEVGYHNPFVFSNAFTKWIGWRPSEYRRKRWSATNNNTVKPGKENANSRPGAHHGFVGAGKRNKLRPLASG